MAVTIAATIAATNGRCRAQVTHALVSLNSSHLSTVSLSPLSLLLTPMPLDPQGVSHSSKAGTNPSSFAPDPWGLLDVDRNNVHDSYVFWCVSDPVCFVSLSSSPHRRILLDNDADMFDRYGALFALRDRAAEAHAAGNTCSDSAKDSARGSARDVDGNGNSGGETSECEGGWSKTSVSVGAAARSAAVEAIVAALFGSTSALLRHEVRAATILP